MAVTELSVEELRAALAEHQPLTVIDVRPAAERAEWSIPGSTHVDTYAALRNGDPGTLQRAAATLPRDIPIVTVCARGRTSQLAAQVLDDMGFKVRSLTGGMTAWTEAWNTADVPLAAGVAAAIVQVRRTGKGCLSYVLGSGSEAAVVDPSLDPAVYLRLASQRGWRIVAVLDTHVHADHVSRAHRLAEAAAAPVFLPAQERVRLPFTPLDDGQEVAVGKTVVKAIRTPGHTHESTCYGFAGRALCTGDTLFLNSVGRPDLEAVGAESAVRAHLLYRSLRERILILSDSLVILPAHASVPLAFDGAPHAASLGTVRSAVSLAALDEEAFVAAVLARIPPTPPNHHRIVQINEGHEPAPPDLQSLEAGANRCAVSG